MEKVKVGINDLVSLYPEIAVEWNYNRNGDTDIKTIFAHSGKKYWWFGKCGHEWEMSVDNRTYLHQGCPFCSGHRILPGFNDLLTLKPDLSKEWHPVLNGTLLPQNVGIGSERQVWWKGLCGHEWKATVYSRVSGSGCPYCSGRRLLVGFNDLATKYPALAEEWHPTKNGNLGPTDIMSAVATKVWWRGKCGHEWQAKINNRTSDGNGCPFCNGRRVLTGYNDLLTLDPELASEWHPSKNGKLKPDMVMPAVNTMVWWKGKCGHEWRATILNRHNGRGCPICSKIYKTSFPEQAIYYYVKRIFPDAINRDVSLGKELDVYIPSLHTGIEYDGSRFHSDLQKDIEKNHWCYDHGVRLMRIREENCPILDDEDVVVRNGYDDGSLNNAIVDVLHLLSTNFCALDIDVRRDNIKILNLFAVANKEKSLLSVNPDLATEWHPSKNGYLMPDMFAANSNQQVWWLCKKNHEWKASVADRQRGRGCPFCSGKRLLKGYNDLETVNPVLASEWNYEKNGDMKPCDISSRNGQKVWWLGKCGHEWQATVYNRSQGRGCPYCAGKRVLEGFNDFKTFFPEIAEEWHPYKNNGLLPSMVTKNSGKKVWWQCSVCGHEWEAIVASRANGTGCPVCVHG